MKERNPRCKEGETPAFTKHPTPLITPHFRPHLPPSQGLLPLDLFAAKLLASPARLLAMEPEQKVRPTTPARGV